MGTSWLYCGRRKGEMQAALNLHVKKYGWKSVLWGAGVNFKSEWTTMSALFINFLLDENGQDLIEYTLLLAFVALSSAALFMNAGKSVKGVWSVANSQLATANLSASS
jgi:Flp pilus assembly pilin Flp